MKVIETAIPGVLIIEPEVFGDSRGFFLEIFRSERYLSAGVQAEFVQDNLSRSERGVIRGLHVQHTFPQGKLVTVLSGCVLDVAVDLRSGSPTFGTHVAVELDEKSRRQLWVPRGLAHGFAVLSETADLFYKCDQQYKPECEISIRWNDPDLGINWPFTEPRLSSKDAAAPLMRSLTTLPAF